MFKITSTKNYIYLSNKLYINNFNIFKSYVHVTLYSEMFRLRMLCIHRYIDRSCEMILLNSRRSTRLVGMFGGRVDLSPPSPPRH